MNDRSEWRVGWPLLVGCFLGMSLGVSSLYFYSIGIFIKPLAAQFDWGRGAASAASMLGTVVSALAAIGVGRLADRIGPVRVAMVSLLLLAASFAALGLLTQDLWSFLALTVLLSLLATGSSAIPYGRLIVADFERNRGLALGIALSGSGLGAMLMPPLLTPFVAHHGWRAGYVALATVIVASLPLLWWLLHAARPTAAPVTTNYPPFREVLCDPAFRWIGVIFFTASIAVFGTIVHFVPMLTDAGLAPGKAGAIAGLIGITAIGGRVLAGWLLDRLPAARVTAGLFVFVAAGLALLAWGGVAFAIPGALIAGFAIGAENDLLAFLVGRYFRRQVYGLAYGALYGAFLIGGAVGPVLSGILFDATASYRTSLLVAAGLLVVAAIASLGLRRLTLR